jgi:hypothetical protein
MRSGALEREAVVSMMGGERDDEILSEWERERLAGIEEELATSDPRLTRRLAGRRRADFTVVLATVLVLLGAAAAVATFTRHLWVAATGLATMATGLYLAVDPVVARLRWHQPPRQAASPRN